MRFRAVEGGFIARFDRGERIPQGIADLCEATGVSAGTAQAIGALEDVELGYYDFSQRTYERMKLAGSQEVISLTSFIATWEGKPFVHTHVVVSGRDFRALGGHLFDAVVSITLELRLFTIESPLHRVMNPDVGLHRIEP